MRTSTLLAVLAALMLLVACAAPVFGQSSSSSTGAASSSSSSATIIASSSSSTGTSTNNNTVASSSAASASSSSSGSNGDYITITVTYPFITNNSAQATQYNSGTVQDIQSVLNTRNSGTSTVSTATLLNGVNQAGTYIVTVAVTNAPSFLLLSLETGKVVSSLYPTLSQSSSITSNQQNPSGGAASTLSISFAAVAVVFAALLQ